MQNDGNHMKTSISYRWPALLTVLGLAALPASGGAAPRTPDLIWVHPRFDSLRVQSVALLPSVSFDKNHRNESFVETMFARALQPAGYRWITPQVAREKIQSAGGDSAVAALNNVILKTGRVDSLSAQRVCSALRTSALMSVRLDQFEQTQVEWNQSGKPTTSVRLRAALVDSTGRLLWSASGSETGEGQYHEADAGTTGVNGSGLNTTPTTAQGGAPSFEDVTTRLLDRWMKRFPARPAAATSVAPAKP
jgi:hypothetical protein